MDYNDFIVQLVESSDSELVEVWKNRDDYTAEAKSLIEKVLEERELLASAQKEEKAIEQEKQEYNHAELQQLAEAYDVKKIGRRITDQDYARKSGLGGDYFSRQLSNSRGLIGRVLLLSFGLVGIIIFFVFLLVENRFTGVILYSGVLGLVLFVFGVYLIIQSKVKLQLIQSKNEPQLMIQDGKKKVNICLLFPFRFEYYWEKVEQSTNYATVTQPRLWLFIWDQKGDLELALKEDLGALYKEPPHWSYIDLEKIGQAPRFEFGGYGLKKLQLYKLVKILNGLKQRHEN